MENANVMQLENIINAGVNAKYVDVPPTEEEFLNEAKALRNSLKSITPVSDEEFEGILSRLRQSIVMQLDVGVYITDPKNGHQSWLPARRADIDFFFWNRYKKYLEMSPGTHWNPRATAGLGRVADEILDLCGDPKGDDFLVKGLVLGDVQSGKTANYTAVLNKAADCGYRVLIVLAGIQENLRVQTQRRLDRELTGRNSRNYLDQNSGTRRNVPLGVGTVPLGVGRQQGNGNQKKIIAFTSDTKDFDSGILNSNNLGIENVDCPVVFVIKKNKKIMENLFSWLNDNNTKNASGKIELPLLLIDDEADNASVNTKNPSAEDNSPTAINNCIRKILGLFSKATYLGITATPFANIFIDPNDDNDLFPSDFIYALTPPSNYIGADRIFGDDADEKNMICLIDEQEIEKYFPPKHKKELVVKDLPADLYEAAYYFLLVNAVRDIRGDVNTHRTMMVHVSRFINVQNQVDSILLAWLDQVKTDLKYYSKLSPREAEKFESIRELHRVWDKYDFSSLAQMGWNEVLRDRLYKAVAPIDVRAVNGSPSATPLDYEKHKKDGLRVIAVGGNSLSRGLTLEGLCVTYFYRNSRMYDTLMQMGRWFGFRSNYEDLVKIWMTEECSDWYGQIIRATDELRDEIRIMHDANQTPREFGLRVRQDPGSLIVTAYNKMRTGTSMEYPVSVSGHLLETPRLRYSSSALQENENLVKKFVNGLSSSGKQIDSSDERARGNYFWKGVPSDSVSALVRNFKTHPWHMNFNGVALADYIEQEYWKNGWDVVLMNTGEGTAYPEEIPYGDGTIQVNATEKRKISIAVNSSTDEKMLSVSGTKLRVGAGGCARIGLTYQQEKDIKEKYQKEFGKKSLPDSAYLVQGRDPILMLHIVNVDRQLLRDDQYVPEFLFAIGLGFPRTGLQTRTAKYIVNLVELSNWVDFSDGEDE